MTAHVGVRTRRVSRIVTDTRRDGLQGPTQRGYQRRRSRQSLIPLQPLPESQRERENSPGRVGRSKIVELAGRSRAVSIDFLLAVVEFCNDPMSFLQKSTSLVKHHQHDDTDVRT